MPDSTQSHNDDILAHDKRYGEQREQLTNEQIHRIASDLANGDHDMACKLILLADEIERAQFNRVDLQNITITIRDAVMPFTSNYSDTHDAMIEAMRAEIATTGRLMSRHEIEG